MRQYYMGIKGMCLQSQAESGFAATMGKPDPLSLSFFVKWA